MGFDKTVFFVALTLVAGNLFQHFLSISVPRPAPKIDVDAYWGPGSKSSHMEDASIQPFTLNYEEDAASLKEQLGRPLVFHEPLEDVNFEYSFNSKTLEKVITYWRDDYLSRWNERQQFLNKFPQFTTEIQGLEIHFLHVKPTNPGSRTVVPLLLLHGWPGSVREFYELIPLLTTPSKGSDYVFEVIAPSLVGFGWSQASSKKNFGPVEMSVVFRNLMLRLGHERFLLQGGDLGSIIATHLATLFPENTIGLYVNLCLVPTFLSGLKLYLTSLCPSLFLENHQKEFHLPVGSALLELIEESGYFHIQTTKSDTIGTALLNNPVGLAAYILEKFSTWTNPAYKQLPDGGLEKRYTLDALLDNIMIYYLSNSILTSLRLYSERYEDSQTNLQMDRVQTNVPTGCARFKYDRMHSTDWQLKEKHTNLVHSTYHNDGGHFIAMELPEELYRDFIKFVKKIVI